MATDPPTQQPPPCQLPPPPPQQPPQQQQQFCLRWNNFQSNIVSSFENLLSQEELVDVTLSAEGQTVRAHKVLLSACSSYFRDLFQTLPPQQHPVVVLRDTRFAELKCLLCFIYHGEVNVSQENLSYLLSLAESLKVKGLAQETTKRHASKEYEQYPSATAFTPEREEDPPCEEELHKRRPSPGLSALLHSTADTSVQQQVHSSSSAAQYSAPQHHRVQSPPGKKRKMQPTNSSNSLHRNTSPPLPTSHNTPHSPVSSQQHHHQISSHQTDNTTSNNNVNNNSDNMQHAVNLSVNASPPPRLVVLKQELQANDDSDNSLADKERLDRDRFSSLLEKERIMKLGGGVIDSEGEEDSRPPEDDGEGRSMSLSRHLQQSFVPYQANTHAAAAAAAAAAQHFATNFSASGSGSASNTTGWRSSHNADQTPSSPQGGHPVLNDLLCGDVLSSPSSAPSTPTVSKKAVPTPCPICNKVLSNAYNMRVHLETHQDITYKCLVCGIVTRTRDTMRKHLSNVHKLRNVELKNSFKKITGKNERSMTQENVKSNKSPPPLITASQAAQAAAFKSKLDLMKKPKSELQNALLLSSPLPPTSASDLSASIASLTNAAISDVTAAAVAALFPGLTNNGGGDTDHMTPPMFTTSPLFTSTPLVSSMFTTSTTTPLLSTTSVMDTDCSSQGNKLASIVNKLSQKQ